MTVLVDTNLLTRAAQPGHPMNPAAVTAVDRLLGRGETLVVAAQTLYEFWVVATRPPGENGLGFSVEQAQTELHRIKGVFPVLAETSELLVIWELLVLRYSVKGKKAHDARIVASMNLHQVGCILTFNAQDFSRYPDITVFDPDKLAEEVAQNELRFDS